MNPNLSTKNLSNKYSKIHFAPFRIFSKATEENLDRGQSVAHQEEISIGNTHVGAQFLYIPSSICEPRLYLHIPSSIRESRFLQRHIPSSICEPRMSYLGSNSTNRAKAEPSKVTATNFPMEAFHFQTTESSTDALSKNPINHDLIYPSPILAYAKMNPKPMNKGHTVHY
jgi:hypothetical protein